MSNEMPRILAERYALAPPPKAGGMADVYKASDLQAAGSHVAVKLLRYRAREEDILAESYRREADALRQLEHPNIVRLLDTGHDEETGRPFLVLEWLTQDLSEHLIDNVPGNWSDFYEYIGRPILEALEFAHSRRISHRDLKPSNVLIATGSAPKLADFGIAKLHSYMRPGVTLAGFSSRPYSPPEPDEGLRPFARDLYAFAVMALESLSGRQFRERADVESAASDSLLPENVRTHLLDCIAADPDQRPEHGGVLLAQLNEATREHSSASTGLTQCWVGVPRKHAQRLKETLGVSSTDGVRERLAEELRGPCAIEPYRTRGEQGERSNVDQQYMIHASTCRLHVAIDRNTRDHLYAFNAWTVSQSECERSREVAWSAPFRFTLGSPRLSSEGEAAIRRLQIGVEEHQAELRIQRARREEQRLFTTWGGLLRARLELEQRKNPPIPYHDREVDGRRVKFRVRAAVSEDWEGTLWRTRLPNGSVARGEVEDIASEWVTLWVTRGAAEDIPNRGRLEFDASAAETALGRQQRVLDTVRFGRATHPTLRDLLLNPGSCRPPEAAEITEFAQSNLDEGKRIAVAKALGVRDLVVIEGPPGTGKTTFIAELVVQLLKKQAGARILLTSQTHVALDNALERVRQLSPDSHMARVASRHATARVADGVRDLLTENALDRWRSDVLSRAETYLEALATEAGVSRQDTHVGLLIIKLLSLRERLQESRRRLEETSTALAEANRQVGALADTTAKEHLSDDVSTWREEMRIVKKQISEVERSIRREDMIGQELLDLSDDDLRKEIGSYLKDAGPARRVRKLLELQNEWSERFGRGGEFLVALLGSADVVAGTCVGVQNIRGSEEIEYDYCIVDEASKATPTEVLVPLSRSRRFILVGDSRQLSPFQDPELKKMGLLTKYRISEEDANATLLDLLEDGLSDQCRVRLRLQHRMVEPIGRLISECFYDGELESARKEADRTLATVLPRPVTWISTSAVPERGERRGGSISNPVETAVIARTVERVNFLAASARKEFSVALLSGYSAQRSALARQIASKERECRALKMEVNTVDAFQGREADVAILSITRSNGDGVAGFMGMAQRVNVALSRGREYLVIVGDYSFCSSLPPEAPLRRVADYVAANVSSCALIEADQ